MRLRNTLLKVWAVSCTSISAMRDSVLCLAIYTGAGEKGGVAGMSDSSPKRKRSVGEAQIVHELPIRLSLWRRAARRDMERMRFVHHSRPSGVSSRRILPYSEKHCMQAVGRSVYASTHELCSWHG